MTTGTRSKIVVITGASSGIGEAAALSTLDALLVDEWDQMIDVKVRGLLHGIAAGIPHFQAQNGGHFVAVASIGAHEVPAT